jgi:predicted ribosome quality control (RQC) complex YloA/Tae2 family protein
VSFYDAWVMAAVAEEVRDLQGTKVQDVVRTSDDCYELELYAQGRRHYLLASLAPQDSRLHLLSQKLRRGAEPSPLHLILKKRLVGARLAAVVQPPFERVLRMLFQHPHEGTLELVAEIMGRYSNLLLLDETEKIVGLHKAIGRRQSRERQLLPGGKYVLPPRPSKKPLTSISLEDVEAWLSRTSGEPLWRVLLANVWGISRLLAREIAFLASGDADAHTADPAAILDVIKELVQRWAEGRWEPQVLLQDGRPWGYTPFRYRHVEESAPAKSMSAAIEAVASAKGSADPYAAARESVRRQIDAARKRLFHQQEALRRQLDGTENADRWKEAADWILAYAGRIAPGAGELKVETGEVFPLDPGLTAVENAQRYIKRYKKAKRAAETVPALLKAVEADLEYLDQLEYDLDAAQNRDEIDAVQLALAEAGFVRQRRKAPRRATGGPRRFLSPDGFTILVGKSVRQNEEITFRRAGPRDIWLHARNVPGAHVVILTGGEPVSEATIEQAARLAAYYSKARGEHAVDVIYTNRKHVRRLPGGHPGQVLVSKSKNITVSGEKPQQVSD